MCKYCNWNNNLDVERDDIFEVEKTDVRKIDYGNEYADFIAMIKDTVTAFLSIYGDELCMDVNLWDFKSDKHGQPYGEGLEVHEHIKIKYCPFCGESLEGREANF